MGSWMSIVVGEQPQQENMPRLRRPAPARAETAARHGDPYVHGALLGLGLALYPATQLRFGGLPLGAGELILVAWIALAIRNQIGRPGVQWNLALSRLALFWLILGLTESFGMVLGVALELFHDIPAIAHDITAFFLLIALGMMMAIELADSRRRRQITWLVISFGAAILCLQLMDAYGAFPLPLAEPWFFDRMRGWSNDPNQLGFFCAFLSLTAVHLAETAERFDETLAALACVALGLWVGILTKSDSFVLCMAAAGIVFMIAKARVWMSATAGPTVGGVIFVFALLSVPFLLAAAAPLAPAFVKYVQEESTTVYDDDNQGATRVALWTEAAAKGVEAGLLGYGPGPHLTSKSFKRPPPAKFEAHNTVMELFTQGGLVAVLAFLWLCLATLLSVWRARLPALTALTFGFIVFSTFHYFVRHPIFWFAIVLCTLEAARGRETESKLPTGRRARMRPLGQVEALS
jgi:hypothetical protein